MNLVQVEAATPGKNKKPSLTLSSNLTLCDEIFDGPHIISDYDFPIVAANRFHGAHCSLKLATLRIKGPSVFNETNFIIWFSKSCHWTSSYARKI
jgi:hypothetical protein